jgi:hypothetical protein
LESGDIIAFVVVRVGENLIESAITRRSADELKLKNGDTVHAAIHKDLDHAGQRSARNHNLRGLLAGTRRGNDQNAKRPPIVGAKLLLE